MRTKLNKVYIASSAVVMAYAFVLLFTQNADAHEAKVTKTQRCVGSVNMLEVTWENDFEQRAVIKTSDGQSFVLPPFGKATGLSSSSITYVVSWRDDFTRSGSVALDPAFEGCVSPVPTVTTSTTAPVTVTATTTTLPAVVVRSPEVVPSVEVSESSVAKAVEVQRIRFTG